MGNEGMHAVDVLCCEKCGRFAGWPPTIVDEETVGISSGTYRRAVKDGNLYTPCRACGVWTRWALMTRAGAVALGIPIPAKKTLARIAA